MTQAITATLKLTLTQASLDAMRADPAAAKAGLASGIAASLDGINAKDVTILSTTPDLGFRRLASERHLQGVELQVDFTVESAEFSVESLTNAVRDARKSEAQPE